VSTLLGLVFFEGTVRLLHLDPGGPPPTWRETYYRTVRSAASRIGWQLAPHQRWKTIYPSNERGYFDAEGAVRYRTNAQGFRGDDFVTERRPGVLRIALLGDSFAFGIGVREEDTVARKLEQDLAPRCRVEVLNFGVLGYSTEQEEALLRKRVLDYQPDLVVVWYFLNDPEIKGTLRFLGAHDKPGFFPLARRFSALARLVGTHLDTGLSVRALVSTYTSAYRADDPRWKTVEEALGRLARTSRERNLPVVLFVHPVLFRLDQRYPFAAVHRQVVEAATRAGLPAFDLFEAFQGRRAEDLWVHRSDQHPNEIGQALAADYAAARLAPLLPACKDAGVAP
jgi:lysophospholipase L1-like esterase